jgi:LPXTG-motif cell wall-anchored protein
MTRPRSTPPPRRRQIAVVAALVLGVLAAPFAAGVVSANAYTADADCLGLVFDMPRTEDGTTVAVTANGRPVPLLWNGRMVSEIRNDVFGAPVRFTVPTPDATQSQAWRVTVVGFNGSATFTETVPACVVPATTATTTTATPATPSAPPVTPSATTVPSTTSTTAPPAVAVAAPPRPPATPSALSPTPVVGTLPATGGSPSVLAFSLASLAMLTGAGLLFVRRRSAS